MIDAGGSTDHPVVGYQILQTPRDMTITKDPLGQDALLAEASRWFAALDAGTVRTEDFEAWRRSDPAHAVAYARIVANWEGIRAVPVFDEAPMRASRRQWLKVAAVGVPAALLGSGFLAERAYAWDSASTGVGETRRVPLPDGSVAYLNTDSALSWRYRGDERLLRLDRGEVALDLRRGGATVLRANEASLPLARGLFDARVTAGQAELTMVDGAAMPLPGDAQGLTLRPNLSVVVGDAGAPRLQTRSSEQVASLMAWRAGEIVFLDQSVAEAAAEFNRHLTRKITVANADLAREKIGGRFDLERPDQFLKAVSLSLDARVVTTADGYELTR
ncbi:MAG: FecR domain-containing protein [Novosphingobium sp.]